MAIGVQRSAAVAIFLGCLGGFVFAGEKVDILRDEFGVPHIFANSPAGAAYGSGYAQAEDRLDEILKNYRKASGTMSEVFGPEYFQHDYIQRFWRHRKLAQQSYAKLTPQIRQIVDAYHAGLTRYMKEHPEKVPAWAPVVEPWDQIALGRYIIFGWPEGEIQGKLARAGIAPEFPSYTSDKAQLEVPPYHGSNEMLIAPKRTVMHAPIAVIDPHLSWYGEFRFYEIRLYGGAFKVSGAAIAGLPFPSLGHSAYCSVAMTTGGPDTSDVYEEEASQGRYLYQGIWKPIMSRTEKIGVKTDHGVDWREVRFEETQHGPIIAHKNGKAYTAATPYVNETGLMEQSYEMMMARNLAEMKKALSMLQLMQQNIMVGTVEGDIYYLRNGRVPVRPKGCDPTKPLVGSTGECDWKGLHKLEDLVQILNPPQGYMDNNNISPQYMMKGSPMTPDKYEADLYNAPNPPVHQRAQMSVEELSEAAHVTAEKAISIAFSPAVYHAELWQKRIAKAASKGSAFAELLEKWSRRSDAMSRAALGFYLFKTSFEDPAIGRAVDPPAGLTDQQVREALVRAEHRLRTEFPPGATFGTYFRVGRKGAKRTYPVSGGTLREAGMATPRAITFSKVGKEMVGHTGQTSTQIVILTKPPQSFMVIPLGESDDPKSPHF
ncbi:MAG TPA: penicillin acylase family protein, partial [Bryobacteraceae bacterium]